jgi:phage-related baseplate assembly protein
VIQRFATIDFSAIPAPDIVETLSFETLRAAILADGVARMNAAGVPYNVSALESDPFVALCEAYAYREMNLRARINDAARAVLLPSSWGTNLDNIGAAFDTARNSGELDAAYQQRIHIAPAAFSSCGPQGAYEYWARTILPLSVDATAVQIAPGKVRVAVLYAAPTLTPPPADLQTLAAALVAPAMKPLTDVVAVTGASIVPATITAVSTLFPGPDAASVQAAQTSALAAFLTANQKLGFALTRSALIAALQVGGVKSVNLISPAADIPIDAASVYSVVSTSLSIAFARET